MQREFFNDTGPFTVFLAMGLEEYMYTASWACQRAGLHANTYMLIVLLADWQIMCMAVEIVFYDGNSLQLS